MNSIARRINLTPVSPQPKPAANDKVIIKTTDYVEIIPAWEISHVEAESNYCTFVLLNGNKITASKTIGTYEKILLANNFIRPHRSFFVSIQQIRRVRKLPYYAICTLQGAEIPISRARRIEVLDELISAYEA